MPKAKEKEFKVEFRKDVNGNWSGSAYVKNPSLKRIVSLSYSVAPGTKANSARVEIRNHLKEMVENYKLDNPGSERVTIEEAQ